MLASDAGTLDRIKERLERARDRYKVTVIHSLDQLEEQLRFARVRGDGLAEAQRLTHKLYGSVGTLGMMELSEVIGAIDRILVSQLSGQVRASPELWRLVERHLIKARAVLTEVPL